MSYYKVKSINFKRTTGQIFVTCADSGSRPLYYERFEYDPLDSRITDFAGKCKEFWMEVLAGNYQFLKSNRWYDAERKACEKMQQIVDYTDIGQYDFMCNTSFRSQLQKYVVKAYLVPLATKEEVTPDAAFEANFIGNCKKEWNRVAEEWKKNKQIPIRSALFSSVFPGWDSLLHNSKNQTIVAKKEYYNNRGLLDNADETAIFLPEGSGDDWGKIAYAKTEDLPEILNKYPQLTGAVTVEASYQSEERAAMDGYKKIFRKPDGIILYAKECDHHETTWAEVIGYVEVY